MNRRYNAAAHISPALTGGDDQPLSPCAKDMEARRARRAETGEWEPSPHDVLMDHISGPDFERALRKARAMCGDCPLMASCLRENRDEQWAKAVMGRDLHRPTKIRRECGTTKGLRYHAGNHEHACDACNAIRSQRGGGRRPVAECGSDGGYYRHLRTLKDEPCEPCRKAHNEAQAKRSRKPREVA